MFQVLDSGVRVDYPSGMRRDTNEGKPNHLLLRDGPMFLRWAMQLTRGAVKYGKRNWQLANSEAEYERFKESACRHFEQWLAGETDEDHAAAVFFNINAAEFTKEKIVTPARVRELVDQGVLTEEEGLETIRRQLTLGNVDEFNAYSAEPATVTTNLIGAKFQGQRFDDVPFPPATTVPPVKESTAWPHMRDTLPLRSAKNKPNGIHLWTGEVDRCCGDPGDCKCG